MDGAKARASGLLAVATMVGVADLERARVGLDRARPQLSARRTLHFTQALWFALIFGLSGLALYVERGWTLNVLHYAALAFFAAMILIRLFAAGRLTRVLTRLAAPEHFPTYTILCPLHQEANVAADLVSALTALDYPEHALQVLILTESDDEETITAALAAAAGTRHIEVIIVPASAPRTKPKALNVGLMRARGEFVVVYDAEDRPHPQQLRAALAAFEDGGERLACVQAPLVVDNADINWLTRQFAAEYAIQFREILPFLADLDLPLPLGGASNHFRTAALRAAGGWDAFNVTEDADLGYRLARDGWRSDTIGPPTWEEGPATFAAWRRQRTRWIKGHMQTWLVLMRNPWRTAREMGVRAFLTMQLILGGGIVAAFAHGPLAFVVLMAMLSPYDLLGRADFILAVFGYCAAVFAALSACALSGSLNHARAALSMPLYWPLSTVAAVYALFELVFRPHHWSKTAHGVSARTRYGGPPPTKRHVSAPKLAARGRS